MLGKKLVVGIRLLTLTGHQQGKGGGGGADLTPHSHGHLSTHTAHPRYVVIEHRFGQGGKIEDVFTGGSVGDVMAKMKGTAHGGGAGHLLSENLHTTNTTTSTHSSLNSGAKANQIPHTGANASGSAHEKGNGSHSPHPPGQHNDKTKGDQMMASGHGGAASFLSSSNSFSIIKPDAMARKAGANGKGGGSMSPVSASPEEIIHQYVEILQTPGRPLPYPWWTQCYNDRIYDCSPSIGIFEREMKTQPASVLLRHYQATQERLNGPSSRTWAVMMRLLSDMPVNEGAIPFYHYMALEFLLGMGFTPVHGVTSLTKRLVDVSSLLPAGSGQLGPHVTYVARLGLHRLLAALLDVGNIRFTHDSAQFRDLLIEARNQPYSLVQLLKRITSPLLKRVIALDCPQCGQLARAIHRLLTFKLPVPLEPLCLANGSHPTVPLQSDLGTLSHGLNQPEQVMLARVVLYLVFDVPLFATSCPRCVDLVNVPQADARTLVNAMLECYCTPHSKFHLVS